MTRPLFLILGGGLFAIAAVFITLQLKTKRKYDELTEFFQKSSVTSTPATSEDDRLVMKITNEWDKHEGRTVPPKDLARYLQLAGFSNTLAGLVAFQTHVIPPYSYFDQERNKIEVIRAVAMNAGWPIGKGEMVVSEDYVYHEQPSGLVSLFVMVDEGIQHSLYTEPKEAEQGRH